ncbi:MAG: phosphotransferase [bacterium]
MQPGIEAALTAFGLVASAEPAPVDNSILNQNYRVDTSEGSYFLRAYRRGRTLERLQREQAAAAWVSERGLPTPVAIASPGAETLIEVEGQFWSLYRWIDGGTYRRGEITPPEAERLGMVHGQCMAILRNYPSLDLPPNSELTWSTEKTIEALEAVASEVDRRGNDQERRWHAKQLAIISSGVARPSTAFAQLATQATHGDYHERNVMFRHDDTLAAVVDWERFCVQPPAFEVLRAVSFMLLLDAEPLRAFLEGFRRNNSLDANAVRPAVDAWWQSSLHNTWVFRDYFLAGNEEARRFLPEEEGRSSRFNDSAFRSWLAETIVRYAC